MIDMFRWDLDRYGKFEDDYDLHLWTVSGSAYLFAGITLADTIILRFRSSSAALLSSSSRRSLSAIFPARTACSYKRCSQSSASELDDGI